MRVLIWIEIGFQIGFRVRARCSLGFRVRCSVWFRVAVWNLVSVRDSLPSNCRWRICGMIIIST